MHSSSLTVAKPESVSPKVTITLQDPPCLFTGEGRPETRNRESEGGAFAIPDPFSVSVPVQKTIEARKRNPKYLSEHFRTNVGSMINEIELISNWEISNNILVFGKISKDEARNFTRDLSYGIEYSNCCLKIGLMKRKWTDQNLLFEEDELERINNLTEGRYPERKSDNVYVFFELVELGRFGKKISDVLKPKKFQ